MENKVDFLEEISDFFSNDGYFFFVPSRKVWSEWDNILNKKEILVNES